METISIPIKILEQTLIDNKETPKISIETNNNSDIQDLAETFIEKENRLLDVHHLSEKDENICQNNNAGTSGKEKASINKTEIAYLGKLIEDLVREKNQLIDTSHNTLCSKKDQQINSESLKPENSQMMVTNIVASAEDQENKNPKSEKQFTNISTAKFVSGQKTFKARLSLQQARTLPQSSSKRQNNSSKKSKVCNLIVKQDSSSSKIRKSLRQAQDQTKESSKNELDQPPYHSQNPLIQCQSSEQPQYSSPRFQDILDVNRTYVNFGFNLPGHISEESLELVNRSNENIVVQIIIECLNSELQNTDEYVYSIRRTHLYDYNDKHLLLMSPYSTAAFKLALKVPNMKLKESIKGAIAINIQGLSKSTKIQLDATVIIPKLYCPKELYHIAFKCNMIKLAIRNGKKQENKIPIKNHSAFPVTLDLDFFKSQPLNDEVIGDAFDFYCFPTMVTIPANGMGIVGILIKPKTNENDKKHHSVKKVLLGKCRESSLIYSFIFWIESLN